VRRDLVCGGVLLAIVAVFWMQRDYGGQLTARFPDFVLMVMAALAVGIIVRALVKRETGEAGERRVDLRYLGAAVALLLAWAVGMSLIGFTISGVIVFVVIAQLIRRGRPQPRLVALDSAVGLAVVVACFFVFTRILLVPLPVSVLIGM